MDFKNLFKKSSSLIGGASKTFKIFQKKVNKLKEQIREQEEHLDEIDSKTSKKKQKTERMTVDLSINSVVKSTLAIMAILALAYFLYEIKSTIIIFFASLFLASVINPGVDFLQKYKIPRYIGVFITYFLVFAILIYIIVSMVPIILEQLSGIAETIGVKELSNIINEIQVLIQSFLVKYDDWITLIQEVLKEEKMIAVLKESFGQLEGVFKGIMLFFATIANVVMVLFITFFIVIDKKNLHAFFISLFPSRHGTYLADKTHIIQSKIGDWIRGQLLLGITMGLITFIVFKILGIKYAMTLAFISAIAEFIPYVGPLITFALAGLIAINQGVVTFMWLCFGYIIIQAAEGNILVPLIMRKSVGMNPITVIVSMLVGWEFWGIPGMIIAIPLAKIVSIFIEDYRGRLK